MCAVFLVVGQGDTVAEVRLHHCETLSSMMFCSLRRWTTRCHLLQLWTIRLLYYHSHAAVWLVATMSRRCKTGCRHQFHSLLQGMLQETADGQMTEGEVRLVFVAQVCDREWSRARTVLSHEALTFPFMNQSSLLGGNVGSKRYRDDDSYDGGRNT